MELLTLLLTFLPIGPSTAYSVSTIPDQLQNVIHNPIIDALSIVRDSLLASSIIPEVLDDFKPEYSLDVTYSSSHTAVSLGNDIPVIHVKDRPVFEIHSLSSDAQVETVKKNTTFTLALTDPDAKSRENPKWSEMCHWLVTNISVADTASQSMVDELESYKPPSPPPKTGKHRYVFVLLKGKEGDELEKPTDRQHWGYGKARHGVRDWAEEMGLKVVGANWFYAQDEKQ